MRIARTIGLLLAVCGIASFAAAQDAEGSKDHPMFSRMPGYQITAYEAQDFGTHEFRTYPETHVEGHYWQIGYEIKEGAKKAGPLQIGRNYTDLIVKRGGQRLTEDLDAGGGYTVARLPVAAGKSVWLELYVSNSGEMYELTVVEQAALKQEVEFNAAELANALNANGSVALHGILFDTGKSTIKPESAATLQTIAQVLNEDASLKLEIQGHTDNVGMPAANLKLSQERAAAVKAHLIQTGGIGADRLTTAGFGDTKPVADNSTEEGRAQNRRVELVKK